MSTTLSLVQQPAAEFIAPPPFRLDVERLRQDFPVLQQEVYPGKPLVFLDSAASAQKPRHAPGADKVHFKPGSWRSTNLVARRYSRPSHSASVASKPTSSTT